MWRVAKSEKIKIVKAQCHYFQKYDTLMPLNEFSIIVETEEPSSPTVTHPTDTLDDVNGILIGHLQRVTYFLASDRLRFVHAI